MFELSYLEKGFCFVYPSFVYDSESLKGKLSDCNIVSSFELSESTDNAMRLTVQFIQIEGQLEDAVTDLFAGINGFPKFDLSGMAGFRNAPFPTISCVILLTANDLFVYNFLIPSIITSSKNFPIEIIIVYNGCFCKLGLFRNFKVVKSSFGWVSNAYNTGIQQSKGKLVAIFHDDCIITDKDWIGKALKELDSGAMAVTPEMQLSPETGLTTAKNVPLVMYRKNFRTAGRYDRRYYAGLEDVDFTYKLLSSGKEIRKLNIGYLHFEGMSTTIMMNPACKVLRELYSSHMIPKSAILQIKAQLFKDMSFELSLVTASSLLRLIKKFNGFLSATGHWQLLDRKEQLQELVQKNKNHPLIKSRKGLVNLYKTQMERY